MLKNSNEKLMQLISFSEKDLNLNRQMKLSEKQKHKFKSTIDLYVFLSFLGTTVFFCIAVVSMMAEVKSTNLFILTFLGISGFGLFFYWAFWSVNSYNQLRKYKGVRYVEGKADFDISYKRNNSSQNGESDVPVYSMKIDGVKFYLSEEIYDSIVGNEFRVYYFQTLKKVILSLENLE